MTAASLGLAHNDPRPGVVSDRLPGGGGRGGNGRQLVGSDAEADDLAARVVELGPAGPGTHEADYSGHGKSLTEAISAATVSSMDNTSNCAGSGRQVPLGTERCYACQRTVRTTIDGIALPHPTPGGAS